CDTSAHASSPSLSSPSRLQLRRDFRNPLIGAYVVVECRELRDLHPHMSAVVSPARQEHVVDLVVVHRVDLRPCVDLPNVLPAERPRLPIRWPGVEKRRVRIITRL